MCIHIHIYIYTYKYIYNFFLLAAKQKKIAVKMKAFITGWRRPIKCLKLQVIFRQKATNYGALSRKMTYEDRASYESSPPCVGWLWLVGSIKL